jgi:hypothetical protein
MTSVSHVRGRGQEPISYASKQAQISWFLNHDEVPDEVEGYPVRLLD